MTVDKTGLTGINKANFQKHINMAFLLNHLALGQISLAENELQQAGKFKLDIKAQFKRAFLECLKIANFTDSTLSKSEDDYNADLAFLQRLIDLLSDKIRDPEKQGLLLDYIANDLKTPDEYPELVKSISYELALERKQNEGKRFLFDSYIKKIREQKKEIDILNSKLQSLIISK